MINPGKVQNQRVRRKKRKSIIRNIKNNERPLHHHDQNPVQAKEINENMIKIEGRKIQMTLETKSEKIENTSK